MRIALAAIAVMAISAVTGGLTAVAVICTFVRHPRGRGDAARHRVVTSPRKARHRAAVLTDSESADPGMVDALTGQLIAQLSPTVPTDIPTAYQSDWICRWCDKREPLTARPRRLVLEEQAAHMAYCAQRPAPLQQRRFVQRDGVDLVSSGSYS